MSDARRFLTGLLGFAPSDEQLAAITAPLRPALVRAGAGTGKTTVMAARVAWLLHSGQVAPDRVLGLTFTNKAADELSARVRGLLSGSVDQGEPTISTYHGFAYDLLSEHGVRLGVEPDVDVMDDGKRFQLAMRVVCGYAEAALPIDRAPAAVAAAVMRLDSELAEHVVTPESVTAHCERLLRELAESDDPKFADPLVVALRGRAALVELVQAFRAAKRKAGVVDFGDYMRYAVELAALPGVCARVRGQFDVVLLDEYQDTSVSQERLLTGLFGGLPVMAVGDPHQSIYGFRGASAASMVRFPASFGDEDGVPADVFHLTANRRSDSRIIAAANDVVAPLREPAGLDRPLVGRDGALPGAVTVALHEREDDETQWVAERVAAYVSGGGHAGDVAILCRTRRNFPQLHAALGARDLPVEVVGLGGLLQLPDVVELCSVLRLLADPGENPSLLRLLVGPRWRIGARDLRLLARRAGELAGGSYGRRSGPLEQQLAEAVSQVDPVDLVCLLDAVDDPGDAAYDPRALERFAELSRQLRTLRSHLGEPLVDLVHRVAVVTGLDVELSVGTDERVLERRTAYGSFLDTVASFCPLSGAPTLGGLLAWLEAREHEADDPDVDRPGTTDSVKLMTVHSAKGLEFPVVVLPYLTDRVFPYVPSGEQASRWPKNPGLLPNPLRGDAASRPGLAELSAQGIAQFSSASLEFEEREERRLMYVAVTRAEHQLLASGSWWGTSQKKPRGPSKFLLELRDHADVELWHDEPADDRNPYLAEPVEIAWRPGTGASARRVQVAAEVQAARRGPGAVGAVGAGAGCSVAQAAPSASQPPLTAAEAATVAGWDRDLELLLAEARADGPGRPVVRLPDVLSASQLMELGRDPEGFARNLYRPMPRPAAAAARRGTSFHAWVAERYQQWALLDPDELPGAMDEPSVELTELQRAFEQLPYAALDPVAVEVPVSLRIAGRTLVGRIDAVFRVEGRWEVVDWKTGRAGADPLQLAVYRLAWAEQQGLDPADVVGVFCYVAEGRVEVLAEPVDRGELESLLGA